jgi:hypothetical protein
MKMKNKFCALAFAMMEFAAKTTDMNFGTVAASATAGTVVLDYADGRTTTGRVSLPFGSTTQQGYLSFILLHCPVYSITQVNKNPVSLRSN